MKTKIINLTALFLLISSSVFAQLDTYLNTLNGNVEKIINKSESKFPNINVLTYNKDGFLINEKHYKSKDIHKIAKVTIDDAKDCPRYMGPY